MKQCGWTLLIGVLAATGVAGCMTAVKMPPYSPELLTGVSGFIIAVDIEVWETRFREKNGKWSVEAREHLIAALAKTFSTDEGVVTVSDALPPVPWHRDPEIGSQVLPRFTIPDCTLAADAVSAKARLEVVAIQTVRSWARWPMAFFYAPESLLIMPFAPTWAAGFWLGAGVTAIRFCLFQPGTTGAAWAYGEWFHGGLDLRNPANVEQLVQRAHEHYRAALAKHGGTPR